MAKKIILNSSSVDLSMFEDEPKKKKQIMQILKFIDKYTDSNIIKKIQMHSKQRVVKDLLQLSAYNCYISALSGEYRGRHSVSKAYRDLEIKATWSKQKRAIEKRKEKVTDKSLESLSTVKNKEKVMKEAINDGKANVLSTLMFSIKDLVDAMKFVVRSFDSQEDNDG